MALATDTQAAAAQETPDGTLVGRNETSKVGFYGTTPIVRPTISVANSGAGTAGAILVALGLAEQVA